MGITLSITIPTYNRASYLNTCLKYLIPQYVKRQDEVEIIICDNASTDNTREIVANYVMNGAKIKYLRNEQNLGYVGNQIKCIENASGKYTALLCDDDIYTEGLLDSILGAARKKEYAFIALNYYAFFENPEKKLKKEFAPEKDVEFKRAFDVLNYPSVGHFSGFVFNTKLAQTALGRSFSGHDLKYFEKHRGIVFDVAARSTLSSGLPSFFIGERLLGARAPSDTDYDILYHICLDNYEYHLSLFEEGSTTKSDLEYRTKLVLGRLPRAIVSNSPLIKNAEIERITGILSGYFRGYPRYDKICYPLLRIVKFYPVKLLFRGIKIFWKAFKVAKRRLAK